MRLLSRGGFPGQFSGTQLESGRRFYNWKVCQPHLPALCFPNQSQQAISQTAVPALRTAGIVLIRVVFFFFFPPIIFALLKEALTLKNRDSLLLIRNGKAEYCLKLDTSPGIGLFQKSYCNYTSLGRRALLYFFTH